MARPDSQIACVPLIYGYVSYAMDGFRPERIGFVDMPVIGDRPPAGSALGGTGLAVSAFSQHQEEAADFAFWVASGPVQAGLYAASGGQPGHALAWESAAVNRPAHGFYKATRATLEGAWVRPRHNGYMAFQQSGSDHINDCLQKRSGGAQFANGLNSLYAQSFARA
jgi:multiple sugar transport system substrate-binding protein